MIKAYSGQTLHIKRNYFTCLPAHYAKCMSLLFIYMLTHFKLLRPVFKSGIGVKSFFWDTRKKKLQKWQESYSGNNLKYMNSELWRAIFYCTGKDT